MAEQAAEIGGIVRNLLGQYGRVKKIPGSGEIVVELLGSANSHRTWREEDCEVVFSPSWAEIEKGASQ